MQSPTKPQFASWLLQQIGSGQYDGLRYVDDDTKFRIPWKHNSRKDCSDDDSKIFRAWAVVSGKIEDYPNDKAKWKTNFRCALNNLTKRFRQLEDHSKEADDPHKLYEIINEYNYEDQDMPSVENDGELDQILGMLDINNHHPVSELHHQHNGEAPANYPPIQPIQPIQHIQPAPAEPHNCPHQNYPAEAQNFVQPSPAEPHNYPDQNYPVEAQNFVQPSPAEPQNYPDQNYPAEAQNYPDLGPQQPPHYQGGVLQPSLYDLEVSIHYRKTEMLRTHVCSSHLQLHYLCEPQVPEPPHLTTICFPSPDPLLDSKQRGFTNRILSSVQRGLRLEVRDTGIYGYRQDSCRVFSSTGDPREAHPDPRALPQEQEVELLSFNKYMTDLMAFQQNRGGSPEYTIHMCFGEKFPDGKPLEKKLIVVKVVPLICRYLHEMAQAEGASSLSDSLSLQISHNSLYDLIHATFSLPLAADVPSYATLGRAPYAAVGGAY